MKVLTKSSIALVVALLATTITKAQGATYLSNLGQPSSGSVAVGSDSWLATSFFSGNNIGGYTLDSIQLAMADASGSPSGFTIMLYSEANNPGGAFPGSSLGTLSGSAEPATGGLYTYTDNLNITLSPATYYFIVLTAGTGVAAGAYDWSLAGTYSYNPGGGWSSGGDVRTSSNGSLWLANAGNLQYAINATAVPEPGFLSLYSICILLLYGWVVRLHIRLPNRTEIVSRCKRRCRAEN
jgi:hypothetical protein